MSAFTVLVKSFRRPAHLQLCLESLRWFWPATVPVIVADDGTEPHIIDRLASDNATRPPAGLPLLYDRLVDNPRGGGKWALSRAGRFAEVVHTCGETWNAAMAAVETEYVFVIEDDAYLCRPDDPAVHLDALARNPSLLCVIGLGLRVDLEARGFGTPFNDGASDGPYHRVFTHQYWPWSFCSLFFRRSDWARIGPWPTGVSTGAMEGWLQGRLRETDDMTRPYAVCREALTRMDQGTRVRVDRPDVAAGAVGHRVYEHADALVRAWLERRWAPTLDETLAARQIVYPPGLRAEDFACATGRVGIGRA